MSEQLNDVLEMCNFIGCSKCGKNVTNIQSDKPIFVRAWVECPECIEKESDYEKQITELQQQIEDMQCCGNCKIDRTEKCRRKDEFTIGNEVCPDWQPDGLTRKEREK